MHYVKSHATLIFCLLILLCGNFIFAQSKKKKPKAVRVTIDFPRPDFPPQIGDLVFLVNLDKDAKVRLSIEKLGGSPIIADSVEVENLLQFFDNLYKTSPNDRNRRLPNIVVRPDPSLRHETILKTILPIRDSSERRIYVEVSKSLHLVVLKKPAPNTRPNPLTLWVSLDYNLNIKLNSEEEGNLKDPSAIQNRLSRVFMDREANGAFREGTNEVEKSVFIKPSPQVMFREIVYLANALQTVGAEPLGLMIDDLGYQE